MALLNGTTNAGGPYWDMNGPNLGAGTAPSGTWDTTSTNWTADPNGGIYTGPWWAPTPSSRPAPDATGSYTITVVTTQTVNNLLVQYGTVTFTGGQLNFKGTGSYYSNYVAAGCTAIFNTPFGGTGSPDKWGPGTAVYNGASTSGGITRSTKEPWPWATTRRSARCGLRSATRRGPTRDAQIGRLDRAHAGQLPGA